MFKLDFLLHNIKRCALIELLTPVHLRKKPLKLLVLFIKRLLLVPELPDRAFKLGVQLRRRLLECLH